MPTPRRTPKVKVVERKLGREGALGQYFQGTGLIEIDPRQKAKEYLDTLIHELLHMYYPDESEENICEVATSIAKEVWKRNFRRISP